MKSLLFKNIQVQTISGCNLKCSFCPNSYIQQEKKLMDKELFKKIINELSELNFKGRFSPYLMNEPLMDERLPDLINYSRTKLPYAKIRINSNGLLLSEDKLSQLFNEGLDEIRISCYSREIYNKLKNFDEFIKCRKLILTPYFLDKYKKQYFNNRGGNIKLPWKEYKKLNSFCERPFIQMYVNCDGDAVLCCSDYEYQAILGNVKEKSLINIWNNDKYTKYRNALSNRKRQKLDLCKDCDYDAAKY